MGANVVPLGYRTDGFGFTGQWYADDEVLHRWLTGTVDGDAVRIAFAADLADRTSVREASAEHERWITPLVPTELEYGWNEGHPDTETT